MSLYTHVEAADDGVVIPQRYPVERYQAVWENSPFEIVTPPPPPKPKESPQFAKSLAVAGVIEIGDITNVTIFDKASGKHFELGPKKTHDGIRLLEVVNDIDPKKVKVKIAKGKNDVTIGFDEKKLVASAKPPGTQAPKPQGPVAPSIPPIRQPGQSAGVDAKTGASSGANSGNAASGGGNASGENSGQPKPNLPPRKPPSPKERLRIVVPGPTA